MPDSSGDRAGAAYLCGQCGGPPHWTLTRTGDAVISWACAEHLSAVADSLQRDFETTELTVTQAWHEGLYGDLHG